MFDTLSQGFKNARLKLQGKTTLTEDNIADALRDVRASLLEADVEMGVVKSFLEIVKERAVGEVVQLKAPKSGKALPPGLKVTPADHFVKICHDELVALMGPVNAKLNLGRNPSVVLMVGLQGSGKTTTAAKLARKLQKEGKKPMFVAADIYRPAAIDQLMTLGRKLGIPVFSIKGMDPVELCKLGLAQAKNVGRDVLIIDTAGRLAIDDKLMTELERIHEATNPTDVLFVCDAMIGQESVRTAVEFDRRVHFTGFVLTKLDGDARGGAALSIKQVTGKPIQFLGMGETLDKLEEFRPEGLADRILGFGDVVGLMKDFEEVVDQEQAEKDAKKMLQGDFTFDDFLKQLGFVKQMGSLRSIMERLPGMGDMLKQLPPEALDDRELGKVEAMIHSMTKHERAVPDLIDESRMRRIAKGSGRPFEEVKDLQVRFVQVRGMMQGLGGMMGMGGGGMPGGGGFPGMPGSGNRAARRGGPPQIGAGAGGGPGGFGAGLLGAMSRAPELSPEERVKRAKDKREERKSRKAQRKKR